MAHHGARRQSQVASDLEALGAQQFDLVVDTAAVVADGPVGFDHAMTRDEDRNRIRRNRSADRALSVGTAARRGEPVIRDHRTRRDLAQEGVRAALEVAFDQAQIHRTIDRVDTALEHAIDFLPDAAHRRLLLGPVELLAQQLERSIASTYEKKMNRRETAIALRDQQLSER